MLIRGFLVVPLDILLRVKYGTFAAELIARHSPRRRESSSLMKPSKSFLKVGTDMARNLFLVIYGYRSRIRIFGSSRKRLMHAAMISQIRIKGPQMLSIRQILANNLKYLMASNSNLDTQVKLATKSQIGQPTIGRTLRQESDAGIGTVHSLARAFKLEAQDLLDAGLIDRLKGSGSNIGSGQGLYEPVPLISWVVAGMLCESIDSIDLKEADDWLQCPYAHSSKAFCLQIKGSSMWPEYRDGEIILVDPSIDPRHNSDVVIRTPEPDSKTTFKRLQITEEGSYLLALNPDFPHRYIEMPEGTSICGVVTGSWLRRN